jgi:pimeloyl-[acyl-carrier protein] synthase
MQTMPARLPHPFSPVGRAEPFESYRWLRANDPVHFDPASRSWFLVAHADCARALSDARFSAALGQRERERDDALPASMLTTDPPDHARLRGPGALLLGPAALRGQAEALDAAIDRVLSPLDGRAEVDPVTDLGEPFANEVFALLLAIPAESRSEFLSLANRISVNLDPLAGPAVGALGRAAAREFTAFMSAHVGKLRTEGVECPLTRLAGDDRLTNGEMLGILTLAVVGGFVPLADLVSQAAYWLGPRPEVYPALREDPGDPAARGPDRAAVLVDELMRLATPIPFTARVTTDDVDIQGATIPASSRVLIVIAAANRDPDVFANPDELEPGRTPNPHLAFGGGPHLCLGAPLVRWAGGALLRAMARRFPEIRTVGTASWDPALIPRRRRGLRLALAR